MNHYKGFLIVTTNEQRDDFVIVAGNVKATERHFRTEEEAIDYIEEKPWCLIAALAYAIAKGVVNKIDLEDKE